MTGVELKAVIRGGAGMNSDHTYVNGESLLDIIKGRSLLESGGTKGGSYCLAFRHRRIPKPGDYTKL